LYHMNKGGHAHTYLEIMEDMVVKYAKRMRRNCISNCFMNSTITRSTEDICCIHSLVAS